MVGWFRPPVFFSTDRSAAFHQLGLLHLDGYVDHHENIPI